MYIYIYTYTHEVRAGPGVVHDGELGLPREGGQVVCTNIISNINSNINSNNIDSNNHRNTTTTTTTATTTNSSNDTILTTRGLKLVHVLLAAGGRGSAQSSSNGTFATVETNR